MQPNEFVARFRAIALEIQAKDSIPAVIILAQAAGESGWGRSAPGNMYFGVKATRSWQGKTQLVRTREVIDGKDFMLNERFRAYDNPEDSFRDHAVFLKTQPRYARLFKTYNRQQFSDYIRTQNPEKYGRFATRIEAFPELSDAYRYAWILDSAGYATAPAYFEFLVSMIETIYRIDNTIV